jgi:hypothetical protein
MFSEVSEPPQLGLVGHTSLSRLSSLSSEDDDSIPSGTDSTLSFAWGPGALAGMVIKWIGESSLDAAAFVVMRWRLMAVKQAVRKRPHIFLETEQASEVQRMYEDLREVCR